MLAERLAQPGAGRLEPFTAVTTASSAIHRRIASERPASSRRRRRIPPKRRGDVGPPSLHRPRSTCGWVRDARRRPGDSERRRHRLACFVCLIEGARASFARSWRLLVLRARPPRRGAFPRMAPTLLQAALFARPSQPRLQFSRRRAKNWIRERIAATFRAPLAKFRVSAVRNFLIKPLT